MTLGTGVLGTGVLGDIEVTASGFKAYWALAAKKSGLTGANQMYPKNNASPERLAIGQVVLIADGTIQTSGVSIVVRGQGGAEAAGGGTTAYGADGTVYYTPTQAETNYTSFVVIAYKASCFSASQTVVTTASATAGQVVLSDSSVDDIWDEPIVGHLTAGTTGLSEALGSAALVDTTITGTPTSTALVLTAGSTIDDFYNDQLIYILSGTGVGQVRPISGYTGSTRTVTVDEPWVTIPAAAARVAILVSHVHPISQMQSGLATAATLSSVLIDTNELQVAHTAGTLGVNVKKINSVTITGDGSATPFNV